MYLSYALKQIEIDACLIEYTGIQIMKANSAKSKTNGFHLY